MAETYIEHGTSRKAIVVIEGTLAAILIACCLLLWLMAIDRLIHGQPIMAWEDRTIVPWTWRTLAISLALAVVFISISQAIVARQFGVDLSVKQPLDNLPIDHRMILIRAFSLACLMTVFTIWILLLAGGGVTWRDLGFRRETWRADLQLGITGFAMLFVPMIAINTLARLTLQSTKEHPFIELIRADPRPSYLWTLTFAAVAVAPLLEEFSFRVLLQGWLERRFYLRYRPTPIVSAVVPQHADTPPTESEGFEVPPPSPGSDTTGRPARGLGEWIPILISSLLFAGAHQDQGAAPIPLFFLAIGLGWLYQRTHRILPSLVVHTLVNAAAMIQLALEVYPR